MRESTIFLATIPPPTHNKPSTVVGSGTFTGAEEQPGITPEGILGGHFKFAAAGRDVAAVTAIVEATTNKVFFNII
nr:hypothetical protein [Okeania sp. SIO3I5]